MLARIINWIKTHKKFIFILLILVVILFLFFLFLQRRREKGPGDFLKLNNYTPGTSIFKSIWTTEPVVFYFNEPLKTETINFEIKPNIRVKLVTEGENPTSFSLVPLDGWNENQLYTITIKKDLTSINGRSLGNDKSISFTRITPPLGDPEYPIAPEEDY